MRSLCVLVLLASCATTTSLGDAPVLPLRTLHLYETGVGFFERSGELSGSQTTLPVPAGHLDDALKTLTVIDAGGETVVHGFELKSSLSNGLARALAGLPTDEEGPISHQHILESLEGAHVVVTTPKAAYAGRLVQVHKSGTCPTGEDDGEDDEGEDQEKSKGQVGTCENAMSLLLLSDSGEIRRLAGDDITSVKPTDPVLLTRLNSALDALSPRAAQTQRDVRLLASTTGPVSLGYVAETPVWRTTYRFVLEPNGTRGQLQSWALVHNDTDENWQGIKLHLVNGRPDSFLFPLAAPRYAWREMVTPENELSTVPQLIDETVDQLWGDFASSVGTALTGGGVGTSYGMGGLGTRGHGGVGGGVGISSLSANQSDLLEVGDLAAIAEAEGSEQAALFNFTLANPLDLRAHGSALVPFVDQTMEVKRVTWIVNDGELARSAVLFTNNTPYTLPAGPIAFFHGTGFAGESALDRTKPGQRTFVTFGVDLDVTVERAGSQSTDKPQRVVVDNDMLVTHFVRQTTITYELENRSGQARLVYLPLDTVDNATIEGADVLDTHPDNNNIIAGFRLDAVSKKRPSLIVKEGLSRNEPVSSITHPALANLVDTESLRAQDRAVLRRALPITAKLKELEERKGKHAGTIAKIEAELGRLKGYLVAMGNKGTDGGSQNLVNRVLAHEDRLATLRDQMATLDDQTGAQRQALADTLRALVQ